MKRPQPKEQQIQRTILEFLWIKKIFAFKSNNTGIKKADGNWIPSGLKGVSDILGILPDGRFLAIEVKRPKSKPTDLQQQFIDNINNNNGVAFVACSVDDVAARLGGTLI